MARRDEEAPPCGLDDVAVVVRWERDGTGLRGQVIAENRGSRACKIAGKPTVTPLRADGSPLPADTVITLEMMTPGYVVLQPGERAASRLTWASWCGDQASGRARVEWTGGWALAEVAGPVQPECVPDRRGFLTSYWFSLID
ncbi:MAG TPA: DUF4232 domain-containing protein [Streptosporangiaceae bacterium]|jgi:hypothetical protein